LLKGDGIHGVASGQLKCWDWI